MSELEHYARDIYELDERIGQLALACGVDLSRPEIVTALIKGRFEVCMRSNVSKASLEELRGLLILKYKIEVSCIDDLGADYCERIVAEQDARLRQRGFPPESLVDDGKKT